MTIIAQKPLGTNQVSGNEQVFQITGFKVDGLNETIEVYYQISDVSKNGSVFYPTRSGRYQRINTEGNDKFNQLNNSPVGDGIRGLFDLDIASITSVDTIDIDLAQNKIK